MSYEPKVYRELGGNRQTIAPGGSLKLGNAVLAVDAAGRVIITGLPTSDPDVAGALWSDAGALKVSSGA